MDEHTPAKRTVTTDSRLLAGIFIAGMGVLLLLYKMNFPIPHWIFSWEVMLILTGLYLGIKSRFQNFSWIILMAVGSLFLWDDVVADVNLHQYITPIILITVGLLFILRPKQRWKQKGNWNKWTGYDNTFNTIKGSSSNAINETDAEWLEINAAFGGVKKIIFSKNFKGGEINCFMGGAEINFLQADMQHPVKLEINNVFGGTKVIVPSNWEIKNEMNAVFGGVDDKRNVAAVVTDPNKTLIVEGNCFFGGIEFRNY